MLRRMIYLSLLWGVGLLLSGCSNSSIQVAQAAPVEQALPEQILDMRNCDNLEELNKPLSAQAQVEQQVSIADEAVVIATGVSMPVPAELKAQLAARIESTYANEYKAANTGIEKYRLVVPPDRIRMYALRWNEQLFSSTVAFVLDDEPCTIAYSYQLKIPELGDYWEITCTA